MVSRRWSISVVAALVVCVPTMVLAGQKSAYVISRHGSPSQAQAYKIDTGILNLAGIAVDEDKEKVYVVKRGKADVYVYSWGSQEETVVFDYNETLVLPYPGETEATWHLLAQNRTGGPSRRFSQ